MKFKTILVLSALFMANSALALGGFTPADEMAKNFVTCSADTSWAANWGRYNVAFDIYTATSKCKQGGPATCWAKVMSCETANGHIQAGFYCACR